MPVHGMINSDLLAGKDYFKVVEDPFGSGEVVTLVQTLKPDTAILHVDKADEEGNAVIKGAMYDDEIIMKAADHVVVTAEKVVPSLVNSFEKQQITIPGFLVDAVVPVERGAQPCSCEGSYEVDDRMLKKFLSGTDLEDHEAWIASYEKLDRTSRSLSRRAVR
jgi:glutaconate CoA-transferase, subunit A